MDEDKRVADIMSREVEVRERNDVLSIADQIMQMKRIRHLVIVDEEGDVAGVLSQRDLFLGALARVIGYGSAGARKVMDTILIKEVMSSNLCTVAPEATLAEAAGLMLNRQIGCLPVVQGEKLVGIVTESDFLRLHRRGA